MDRLFIAFERRLEVAPQRQHLALVVMSRKRARIELQCPIDGGERFIGLLPPNVQHGEIDESFSERRGERSHLEQHLLALVELSLIKINRGEIRIRRMNVGLEGERLLILTDGVRNTLRVLISLPQIKVRTRLRRGLRYGIFPKSDIVREDRVARDGHECKGQHDAGSHSQPQARSIPAYPLKDPRKDQSDSQTRNVCAVLQNNIGQWNRYIGEKWRNHNGRDTQCQQRFLPRGSQCDPCQTHKYCNRHQKLGTVPMVDGFNLRIDRKADGNKKTWKIVFDDGGHIGLKISCWCQDLVETGGNEHSIAAHHSI